MTGSSGRDGFCTYCGHTLNVHSLSRCRNCKKPFDICKATIHGSDERGWFICQVPCNCGPRYYPPDANAARPLPERHWATSHPDYREPVYVDGTSYLSNPSTLQAAETPERARHQRTFSVGSDDVLSSGNTAAGSFRRMMPAGDTYAGPYDDLYPGITDQMSQLEIASGATEDQDQPQDEDDYPQGEDDNAPETVASSSKAPKSKVSSSKAPKSKVSSSKAPKSKVSSSRKKSEVSSEGEVTWVPQWGDLDEETSTIYDPVKRKHREVFFEWVNDIEYGFIRKKGGQKIYLE